MKTENLIKNICDQVKEAQIKLGYVRETVRLYYPKESLKAILGVDSKEEDAWIEKLMTDPLFCDGVLGALTIQGKRRMEICIPPKGAEYVFTQIPDPLFLVDLIHLFQTNHHCQLEDIHKIFGKYSSSYRFEKMPEGSDFDYVFSFVDKTVDGYYYCIKEEMNHTIYHRFAPEDYQLLLEFM